MKNLFKILLFIVLMFKSSFANDVKFIFLTDINLNSKDKTTISDFQKAISEINKFKDVDFVVLGGNNIAKADMNNLKCLCKNIKKIHKKTYVLLGSSDVLSSNGVNKDFYLKKVRLALKFRHSKKPNYTFEQKGYRFVVMDGSKQYFQSSNGYYDANELLWLDKTLDKYKKQDVIILQHFPIIPTKSEWKMTSKLENYYKVLNKHNNVKLIVSGHYNTNLETKYANIYNILTQDFSPECAYKIIEVNLKDNFIGTYLVKE